MQTTSELYKELLARNARKEVRLEIEGEVYGQDRIVSLSTAGSIFSTDTLCVGSAVARQIDLVIVDYGDIPKMAKLIPSYRLVDGEQVSEWIQKGVFYIDTRNPDKGSGMLTIHGFDDMLKAAVLWEPDQTLDFPMTFRDAALEIARLMGVELENPEAISETYLVDYPANGYTQRNILQFIAAGHAANFIMTDAGKLRMVRINDLPVETGNLVNEGGKAILVGGLKLRISNTTENNLTGMGEKVFVGGNVSATGAPTKFDPISHIIVKVDENNAFFAGDETGYTLEVACPYGTQEMADDLLSVVGGYVYQPFTAEDAIVDQAIELGDGITVDGVYTVLAKQDILFDSLMTGAVSAPGQQEIGSEYPYQTKEQLINLRIAQTNSRITKTAEEILLEVTGLNDKYTSLSVTIDGVTVKDETGATRIKGSSIETETLFVNAANITGALTIGQLPNDVATEDQIPIYTSELINNSGYQNATGVVSIIDGTVTADYIYALGVEASVIRGGTIAIKNAAGVTTATITPGLTTGEGFDLTSTGNLFLAGRYGWFEVNGNAAYVNATNTDGECFCPSGTNLDLGSSTYGLWDAVYALSSTITTSDQNLKHSIEELPNKYLAMMDMLMPKRFQYNSGTSGRYHTGFIAQDVKAAMDACGINSLEFGGWVKDVDADGNEIYMLRYEEFIAIMWAKIRQQEKRLAALEG